MWMSRSARFLYIAATLLGAVFILVYRGPYWTFVRSYGGDWLVVQFIYLIARFWIADRWRYHLAAAVLLLGVLVEVIQLLSAGLIPRTFVAEVTIGSTFDPLDIIAFALGLITVLVAEQIPSKRTSTA
jgi:hypothetical protein